MKKIIIVFTSLCLGLSASSQTDTTIINSADPHIVGEVEISTEKRIPGNDLETSGRNTVILSAEEISHLSATTIHEVLQTVSGIDLRQRGPYGTQSDIGIMGSTFEQVLVLVNGIPMRDPQTGHHQMNLPVDLSQVERIEIHKSSAARIYGANAMAGAINIITKKPVSDSVDLGLFAGSNFENDTSSGDTYYTSGGNIGIGIAGEKAGHHLDISFIESNGYRHNSNTSQQRINYLGSLRFKNSSADLFAGTVFNEFGANAFYAAPYDKESKEKVNTSYGGIKFEQQLGAWKIRPLAYIRYNHDDYIFKKQDPSYYRNNHFTTAAGLELHAAKNNKFGATGLGAESRAEIIHSNNLGSHERYYYAVYAEQQFNFSNRSNITVGANAQYNSTFGWHFYPGAEMNFKLYKKIHLFANAGLSNRMPSFTDLYYEGPSNIGNENLAPEKALNGEAGLKLFDKGWQAQASVFARNSTDFIDFTRDADTLSWQPRNFSHVIMRGIDARIQYLFSSKSNVALQSIYAGYTFIDGNINLENQQSKYALEHFSHHLTFRISARTGNYFSHTLSVKYAERFNGVDYTVCDYRAMFSLKKWNAFVDVTNFLDRSYIESGQIPMPGRWFRLGVNFKIYDKV